MAVIIVGFRNGYVEPIANPVNDRFNYTALFLQGSDAVEFKFYFACADHHVVTMNISFDKNSLSSGEGQPPKTTAQNNCFPSQPVRDIPWIVLCGSPSIPSPANTLSSKSPKGTSGSNSSHNPAKSLQDNHLYSKFKRRLI
ncbi:MAG: hypothetical protein WC913_06745 [Desulfuromonas sp.]